MNEESIIETLSIDEYEIKHYDFSSSSFINECMYSLSNSFSK